MCEATGSSRAESALLCPSPREWAGTKFSQRPFSKSTCQGCCYACIQVVPGQQREPRPAWPELHPQRVFSMQSPQYRLSQSSNICTRYWDARNGILNLLAWEPQLCSYVSPLLLFTGPLYMCSFFPSLLLVVVFVGRDS